MHVRLAMLRASCRNSLGLAATIATLPVLPFVLYFAYYMFLMGAALFAAIQSQVTDVLSWAPPTVAAVLGWMSLLIPLVVIGCIAFLMWKLALSYFARHYWRVIAELDNSALMAMVINEEWTRVLAQLAEENNLIRWMGPPEPKRMEHQLEYAACYYDQLRLLQSGRRHIDGISLWSGALGWFAGQRRWFVCTCLPASCPWCTTCTLPWLVASGIYYIQKIAATTAFCDFLLRGTQYEGPLPDIAKLQPRRRSVITGPPLYPDS
jgi:hypothetical protein